MRIDRQEIEDFLFHEARLLDERRLEEWLELFAEDGVFWIPINEDADPKTEPSILYDDAERRAWRVKQVLHPAHHSQSPPSRTVHSITNVQVEPGEADGTAVVRCNLNVSEMRSGDSQAIQYGLGKRWDLVGRCRYHLRREDGRWAIVLKKVTLIDCAQPVQNLSFII